MTCSRTIYDDHVITTKSPSPFFLFMEKKEIPSIPTSSAFQIFLLYMQINAYLFDSSFMFSSLSISCPFFSLSLSPMALELGKPRVTEIQVRMDCNGCVQKIKRALHGINGIYDLYIDFPQQKLTVIGWADPEKIVKAIRKTRKIATICSHTEPSDQPANSQSGEPPQQAPEGAAPPPAGEAVNHPLTEGPLAEAAAPPVEPPKELPLSPPEEKPSPSPIAAETNANQPQQPSVPKDVGEVHVIYHHQPADYGYRYGYGNTQSYSGGQWNRFHNGHGTPLELHQPMHVTHSYNTYRPSPYITEYEYIQSPPQRTIYSRTNNYSEDYHENTHNGNITSIFSDENPYACTIV